MLGIARIVGQAGRLLGGIRKHVPHLIGIEAGERAGRSGGAEHGAEAVRIVPGLGKFVGAQRLGEARADVVTQCHGAQERSAAGHLALCHRERRRDYAAARVRERRSVRVVRLVGVREHAARQSGIDDGGNDARPRHAGLARAALRFHVRDRPLAGQQARA